MDTIGQAYIEGFERHCRERGVDPQSLVKSAGVPWGKLLGAAGLGGLGLLGLGAGGLAGMSAANWYGSTPNYISNLAGNIGAYMGGRPVAKNWLDLTPAEIKRVESQNEERKKLGLQPSYPTGYTPETFRELTGPKIEAPATTEVQKAKTDF